MVNSAIMLAVAGSGKTYHLANNFDHNKKNIFVTYTNQNVENIKREILVKYKKFPANTQVLTFSSFIFRWLLKPVEPILNIGDKSGLISQGVEVLKAPEPQRIKGQFNYKYKTKDDYRHYMYNEKYYVSKMSSLILNQPKSVKDLMLRRLAKFCDVLYFDELQDFIGPDFDLLLLLLKNKDLKIFAVGDFYQHSVSKSNHSSNKPFVKKMKLYLTLEEYIALFSKYAKVDQVTLMSSRRVPENICKFIQSKLNISMHSSSSVNGAYSLVQDPQKIREIFNDKNIVKLFYNNSKIYKCSPTINWGYSKGDTYKNICIILTGTYKKLFEDSFSTTDLTPMQINTLYVAISRATHNVYFIYEKDFKKIKNEFI